MMERPVNMTDEIHNLMAQCWNFEPGLRPNWPKIEDNTRNYYQYYQPREYLAMASKSTPIVKKGSLTHCGRNRMDSTSSRLTNSSVSSNGTLQNPTTYLGESAPLIRCSTGSSSMNRHNKGCQHYFDDTKMHNVVAKVDSGIERDAPPPLGRWHDSCCHDDDVFKTMNNRGYESYSQEINSRLKIDERGDNCTMHHRCCSSIGSNNFEQCHTCSRNNYLPKRSKLGYGYSTKPTEISECTYATILNDHNENVV